MLFRKWIGLVLLAWVLAACGVPAAPTVGEAKDFATACDKANNGKRISIEGFLRLPESYTGDQSMVLRLYQSVDFSEKPIGVQTEIGTTANHVEAVPDQYSDNDLKVYQADGQVATLGTKVKVSGKVYFPIVAQDFDCSLENPLVEAAN